MMILDMLMNDENEHYYTSDVDFLFDFSPVTAEVTLNLTWLMTLARQAFWTIRS